MGKENKSYPLTPMEAWVEEPEKSCKLAVVPTVALGGTVPLPCPFPAILTPRPNNRERLSLHLPVYPLGTPPALTN